MSHLNKLVINHVCENNQLLKKSSGYNQLITLACNIFCQQKFSFEYTFVFEASKLFKVLIYKYMPI